MQNERPRRVPLFVSAEQHITELEDALKHARAVADAGARIGCGGSLQPNGPYTARAARWRPLQETGGLTVRTQRAGVSVSSSGTTSLRRMTQRPCCHSAAQSALATHYLNGREKASAGSRKSRCPRHSRSRG